MNMVLVCTQMFHGSKIVPMIHNYIHNTLLLILNTTCTFSYINKVHGNRTQLLKTLEISTCLVFS